MLLAAGGGYALASGGSSITLCVKKHGGTVYKAKKCHKGDSKLTVGKTGPAGPAGATGKTGATGQAGAPGQPGSSAGFATFRATSNPVTIGSSLMTVDTLSSLPAGHYIVTGAVSLGDNSDTLVDAVCEVEANGTEAAEDKTATTTDAPEQDAAVTAAVTLSSTGTVTLSCFESGGTNLHAADSQLTAVQVASLTGSTF